MNDKKPAQKGAAFGILMMLMVATVSLLAMSIPASAHDCKSEDHSGCDSHSCPDDGDSHNHRHDVHWWRDHGCTSSPSCNTDGVAEVETTPLPVGVDVVDCGGGDGIYTPSPYELTGIDIE